LPVPALLTAAELRAHCRVDDAGEDTLLLAMGAAAERHIEAQTGCVLTRRSEFVRDTDWPHDSMELVRYPVHAVTSITYKDEAGAAQTLSPTVYWLQPGKIAQIKLRTGQTWPDIQDDSVIDFTLDVGFPSGACPEQLRHACLLLAGHFYANRETVAFSASVVEMPFAVSALIADFRLLSIA
jgi:uncharacterized phiE125 gp8 family phage protein